MGHWNGDRDCDPAQLTACRSGGKLPPCRVTSTEPRFGCQPLPRRGFDLTFAASSASRFLFDAASQKCAMPIARSAPTAVSAIEIARAKRTILIVSHRDKDRTPVSTLPIFRDGREDRG